MKKTPFFAVVAAVLLAAALSGCPPVIVNEEGITVNRTVSGSASDAAPALEITIAAGKGSFASFPPPEAFSLDGLTAPSGSSQVRIIGASKYTALALDSQRVYLIPTAGNAFQGTVKLIRIGKSAFKDEVPPSSADDISASFTPSPSGGAPVYQNFTLSADKKTVTLAFDQALVNASADTAALKSKVTFAADGAAFAPLAADDTVNISEKNLAVVFSTPLTGSGAKISVASGAVKKASGGASNAAFTTLAINAAADIRFAD